MSLWCNNVSWRQKKWKLEVNAVAATWENVALLCVVFLGAKTAKVKTKRWNVIDFLTQSNHRWLWLNAIRRKDWAESIIKNSECTHIFNKVCIMLQQNSSLKHANQCLQTSLLLVCCLSPATRCPPPPQKKNVTLFTSCEGVYKSWLCW